MKTRLVLKVMLTGFVLAVLLPGESSLFHECTQAAILGPLGPGLTYTDGSNPIIIGHKNGRDSYFVRLFEEGTQSYWGDYTYEHDFIGCTRDDLGAFTGMNVTGSGLNVINADDPSGPKIEGLRERAAALADDYEELDEILKPESWQHTPGIAAFDRDGNIQIGYIKRDVLTTMNPDNPFYIERVDAEEGEALLRDTSNWFHGDPNLLEVRDVAYIWHRFNSSSHYSAIILPKHNIFWCTAAHTNDSPFIPFDLNDPYVHPALQDYSYYNSADYSQSEIDAIEDAIMAVDGSVIGNVREIQRRIVEGWFNTSSTCEVAGGQCCPNQCDSYDDCTPLEGTCSSGYCCHGSCGKSGDLNQDGRIDEDDVQLCIEVFLEFERNPDIAVRADVNEDGIVNILDVQEIINLKE